MMTDRTKFLGASEVAAALGLNPYLTPYELWAIKTGRLEPQPSTDATEIGNALEPVILSRAEQILGPLQRNTEWPIAGTPIVAHPDGITQAKEPVEAKTSGIIRATQEQQEEWGEPGTDQIPIYYLVQCLIQLRAVAAPRGYVPALIGGRGFAMYTVSEDPALEAELVERACRWWEHHVVGDRPPEAHPMPALESLKRLRRVPAKQIELPDIALVEAWQAAKTKARQAQQEAAEAEARLLLALGDAEEAILPDGRQLTYYEQKRRSYTVPESVFRVLRLKGGKNE